MYSFVRKVWCSNVLIGMAVYIVDMNAGFGLNNQEQIHITNRNEPARIKNIIGKETAVNKNSIAGAATNLPKPKPVIAKPLARPL